MARGERTENHPNRKVSKEALSKTKANPVTIISGRADLTPAELAEHAKFVTDSNIQGRFEAMDRSVQLPLERY